MSTRFMLRTSLYAKSGWEEPVVDSGVIVQLGEATLLQQ